VPVTAAIIGQATPTKGMRCKNGKSIEPQRTQRNAEDCKSQGTGAEQRPVDPEAFLDWNDNDRRSSVVVSFFSAFLCVPLRSSAFLCVPLRSSAVQCSCRFAAKDSVFCGSMLLPFCRGGQRSLRFNVTGFNI
jgi:hypothetical protein